MPNPPHRELEKIPSGIPGLDSVLRGGFPKGGITIIQGIPGAGKTIFGNQLCYHHVANGGKAIYVTLLAESHARMMLHMSQLAFFDPAAVPDRLYLISAFRVLEEDGLKGLQDLLRREVQRFRASILVLDGLVAAEESAGSAREFKKFIHELQTQASLTDCTMFLLTGAQTRPIAPEHTMVDGVIELKSELFGRRAERGLTVHKMRGVGMMLGHHSMKITEEGMEVFPRIEATGPVASQSHVAGRPLSTGLAVLDRMTGGGLPLASTSLVVGPAGVGKTTLGLHFLNGCSAEEPGLMIGFFESPHAIYLKAKSLRLPLAGMIESGLVEILWWPTTEAMVDEVAARLLENMLRRRVRRLFVDGIGGLQALISDQNRLARILAALSLQFQTSDTTVIYTAESQPSGYIHDLPLDGISLHGVSAVAQSILVMRYLESQSRLLRSISVLKVRSAPIDPIARLFEVTPSGIEIEPDTATSMDAVAAAEASRNGRPAPEPSKD